MNTSIKDVDSYIASLPKDVIPAFVKVWELIKLAAPKAEATISYGMPMLKYNGMLVGIAAWKNHIGFYPCNAGLVAEMKDELKGYKTSKGTIQFPIDKPMPMALIKKIVKIRMKENLSKKKK